MSMTKLGILQVVEKLYSDILHLPDVDSYVKENTRLKQQLENIDQDLIVEINQQRFIIDDLTKRLHTSESHRMITHDMLYKANMKIASLIYGNRS